MNSKVFILLLLFSANLFSQTKQNQVRIKKLIVADSVFFSAETSGCFGGGSKEYKFCKLKNGNRQLVFTENNVVIIRQIKSKQFKSFLNRFFRSAEHFKEDKNPTCTLTTDFELTDRKEKIAFKNGTCENDYNPELFLLELLKKQ